MIYSSEKIKRILQSPEAQKLLNYVTPMYGDDETALWIFESIGLQLDDLVKWTEELWQQINPATATWTLPYWEQESNIKIDSTIPISQRQQALIAKLQTRAPKNPYKVESIVYAITGIQAEVKERTAKNTFEIVMMGRSDKIAQLRAFIDGAKPAHLIYTIVQSQLREHLIPVIIGAYSTYKATYRNSVQWVISPLQPITTRNQQAIAETSRYIYRNEVQ